MSSDEGLGRAKTRFDFHRRGSLGEVQFNFRMPTRVAYDLEAADGSRQGIARI